MAQPQDLSSILSGIPDDPGQTTTTPGVDLSSIPDAPLWQKAYDVMFNAPALVTEPATKFAESMSQPSADTSVLGAQLQGFLGGAVEGASKLLSPANILTAGRGGVLRNIAGRILGGAEVTHGAHEVLSGNPIEGLGDIAFGALDIGTSSPKIKLPETTPTPREPAKLIMKDDSIVAKPEEPTIIEAKPKYSNAMFEAEKKRFYELVDKGTSGTLTGPELEEAKILNRRLRDANFEPPELPVTPTASVTPKFGQKSGKSTDELIASITGKTPEPVVRPSQPLSPESISQLQALPVGSRIAIDKEPDPESLAQARQLGWVPDGILAGGKRFRYKRVSTPEQAAATAVEVEKKLEPIIIRMKDIKPEEAGVLREAWNLSRGLMAVDLPFITSAGLRQGLPLVGTTNWFKAWGPSFKAYGSKAAYNAHYHMMLQDPLMKRPIGPTGKTVKGQPVHRELPSIMERAGVKLTNIEHLTSREESIRSQLAEKMPFGYGKLVAASNRAYEAFINDLRLSTFRNLHDAMPDKNDDTALRALGDFVNTATGRGPLTVKLPGGKELSAEKYASELSEVLFAPKLIAARVQMMNPMNYVQANPQARKEYWMAGLRTAAAWTTFAGIGASLLDGEVSLDPKSADFGKVRVGDMRLDPAGGFQQYLVLASRLATNEFTSSNAPVSQQRPREMGRSFTDPTRGRVLQDFVANKLHPSLRYFYDAAFSSRYRPFPMMDRAIEMAIPMATRDLIEISQESPELLPMIAPLVSGGMGAQFYERGRNQPFIVPPEMDITLGR